MDMMHHLKRKALGEILAIIFTKFALEANTTPWRNRQRIKPIVQRAA